jgi:plastocyanin
LTYPSLTLAPLPAASSGSETVTLDSTVPTGLALTFSPNSVKLTTDIRASVGMTITSSQSVTPGDYKITVTAHYGTSSKTYDFTVKVVQYLVLLQGNNFNPPALTVKQGTTVYWVNTDAPAGNDNEIHNVVFSSGSSAHSQDLMQYDYFSYTFTTPAAYSYFCSYHAGMRGTVTVTA